MGGKGSKVLGTFFGDPSFPITWENEEEKKLHFWFDDAHTPNPLTPLYTSIHGPIVWDTTCTYGINRLSLPFAKGVKSKTVNGYVYAAVVPTTEEERKQRQPMFDFMLPHYLKSLPTMWRDKFEPELRRNLLYLDAENYRGSSLAELMSWVDDALEVAYRHFAIHWFLNLTQFLGFLTYEQTYTELVGDVPETVRNLPLCTHNNKNMEVLEGLWRLKEHVRQNPALVRCFSKATGREILSELETAEGGEVFLRKLNEFLRAYGNKAAYVFEFIYPSWREDPSPALEILKTYLETGYDHPSQVAKIAADRAKAVEEAKAKIRREEDRKRFEAVLEMAYDLAPITPNHHFYIDQWTIASLRPVFLEVGRRLREAGVIDVEEDVFYLTLDQLREIVANASAFDARAVVAAARKLRAERLKLTPAPNIGTITEESAQDPVKVKLWGWKLPEDRLPRGSLLKGHPASGGVVEGVAKVVLSPEEFGKVTDGDILVCELTNPVWTPLFSKIKGLVTDSGGMLAHPAIVAREFRIPAVVGTVHATKTVKSGRKVRVDGDRGTVEILDGI